MGRHRVARADEIPERRGLIVDVNGVEIGIFRVGGRVVAWRNVCPHMAAPVCKGAVAGTMLRSRVYEYEYGRDGEILQCPWHGWEFALLTGRHLVAGSRARLRQYPVEIEEPARPDQLAQVLAMMSAESTVMFSSDYPHWDNDDPRRILRRGDPAVRARILGGTAAELYGLDAAPDPGCRGCG